MPFIVVDVGNTRMKWGLASEQAILDATVLPLDDINAWQEQRRAWSPALPLPHGERPPSLPLPSGERVGVRGESQAPDRWIVTGSNPRIIATLTTWLQKDAQPVRELLSYRLIPLQLAVEHPETVGLDRLFNALAVAEHLRREQPAIIVDAGSAVTVDLVGAEGVFRGGAIFPGLRLMAKSLNDYVPQLPIVELKQANPPMPGLATVPALEAGVHGAVVGGIQYLVDKLRQATPDARCFLTGGDAAVLAPALTGDFKLWPWLTLEGVRLTALALP